MNTLVSRSVGGNQISSTTIIIIAVCGSAGLVILVLILRKAIRACRSTPVPLPPIQPLAHHRDQQQEYLPHNSSFLAVHRRTHLRAEGSYASLLPSYQPSLHSDSVAYAPDSSDHSESCLPDQSSQRKYAGLTSPQGSGDFSASGIARSNEGSCSQNEAVSTSSFPQMQGNQSQISIHVPSNASTSHISVAGSGRPNKNTIRGFPHGPHSSIQIVLPAPLAPQLDPHQSGVSTEDLSARNSYVDKWALAPSRSTALRSDSERSRLATLRPPPSQRLAPSASVVNTNAQSSLGFPPEQRYPSRTPSKHPGSHSNTSSNPPVPSLPYGVPQIQVQLQQSHSPEDNPRAVHRTAPSSAANNAASSGDNLTVKSRQYSKS